MIRMWKKNPVMHHPMLITGGKGDHEGYGTITNAMNAIYTRAGGVCKFVYCPLCDAWHLPEGFGIADAQEMAKVTGGKIGISDVKLVVAPSVVRRE